MKDGFHFRIDRRDLASRLVHAAAADALTDATEALLTEANTTVPLDESTLQRSGTASVDRQALRGAVSYDTPYAVVQHERTEFRHPGGRRAKWLEHTFREMSGRLGGFIAGRIKRGLG